MAKGTYRGLRKRDDPIYDEISIVVGGGRRPSPRPSSEPEGAKPKQPDERPSSRRRNRKGQTPANEQ